MDDGNYASSDCNSQDMGRGAKEFESLGNSMRKRGVYQASVAQAYAWLNEDIAEAVRKQAAEERAAARLAKRSAPGYEPSLWERFVDFWYQ